MSTETIPSPLGLLHRSHHAGTLAATDALICTFNQDLAFFERAVLGVLSQTKARITLLGDAEMVEFDPYSVRRAGTTYLPGLAAHKAAFHPKLLLLVSDEQATIAIGSGNLTLSGWQGNDELWTIHELDSEITSPVAAGLADWLRALSHEPGGIRLSSGVSERLLECARKLDRFGGDADEDPPQFVSSMTAPIIEQLPVGPVEHLVLYAPYHDAQTSALRALVDRFQPRRVTLAYQARHTSVNGSRAAEVLAGTGMAVAIDDQPFRHGKLIEWQNGDGSRLALTGSPNLSDVALLQSVPAGGNVEIGVIAPVASTLLPPATSGEPPALGSLSPNRPDDAETDGTRCPALLLDAAKAGPVVEVRYLRPLPKGAKVEHSLWGGSPDHWVASPLVNETSGGCTIAADLPGGSRVRVFLPDGTWSLSVSVIDFDRLRRASRSSGARTKRAPDVINVFGDDTSLMASLLDTLSDLGGVRPERAAGGPASGGGGSAAGYQGWDDYLDGCHERIGDLNLSFALGLPMTASASAAAHSQFVDWDDDEPISEEVGALEDDEADDESDEGPQLSDEWFRLKLEREARRRYRRQIEMFVDQVLETPGGPDPIAHLSAIRLILLFAAGGIWGAGEEWRNRLLGLVEALDREAPDPEWETSAASLAALSLAIVDFTLPTVDRTLLHGAFERAADRVGYLTLAADDERVRQYGEGLGARYRYSVDAENVRHLIERLTLDDPLERAVAELIDDGVGVAAVGRLLVLDDVQGISQHAALRALPFVNDASPVGVFAESPKDWTLVLWDQPDLYIVRSGAKAGTAMSQHYVYKHGTPAAEVRSAQRLSSSCEVSADMTMATQPPPDRAVEIAQKVGVSDVLNPQVDLA